MTFVRIDGYPIDLALSEEYSYKNTITKNPVEKGADITDHIRAGNLDLRLEGMVSDTPIGAIAGDPTRVAAFTALLVNPGAPKPGRDAYQRLLGLQFSKKIVTVECSLGIFEDMAIAELTIPRNSKNFKGLQFTVSFEHVEFVKNVITTPTATPGGQRKQNLGLRVGQSINFAHILWRQGKPPGAGPLTKPPGVIVGQETIEIENGKYFHIAGEHGNIVRLELTPIEKQAFDRDMRRDFDEGLDTLRARAASDRAYAKVAPSTKQRFDQADRVRQGKDGVGKKPDPGLFGK